MRLEVPRAGAGFRVSNILTQKALIEQHMVRERLLAMLALFFGVVALVLAGVGLYGVLDYSVLQRRREIGIRLAIWAQPRDIAQRVIGGALAVVLVGSSIGIILGITSVRFIEALLFGVKATDLGVLGLPAAAILAVSLLAMMPAVVRAVRVDPVRILRSEELRKQSCQFYQPRLPVHFSLSIEEAATFSYVRGARARWERDKRKLRDLFLGNWSQIAGRDIRYEMVVPLAGLRESPRIEGFAILGPHWRMPRGLAVHYFPQTPAG